MNSKMTTNSQLSTTEPTKKTQSKQLEKEQNTRSHGELSVERERETMGGKGTGNKKHKW